MSEDSLVGVIPETKPKGGEPKKTIVDKVLNPFRHNVPKDIPSTQSVWKDTAGWLLFKDKYVLSLHRKYGPVVGIGLLGGKHAVFFKLASQYRSLLDDEEGAIAGKREYVHGAIKQAVGDSTLINASRVPEEKPAEAAQDANATTEEQVEKKALAYIDTLAYHDEMRKATAREVAPGRKDHKELYLSIIRGHADRIGRELNRKYHDAIDNHTVAEVDLSGVMVDFTFHGIVDTLFSVSDINVEIAKMNANDFVGKRTNINGFGAMKAAIHTSNERISAIVNSGGKELYYLNPANALLEAKFNKAVAILDTYAAWMDQNGSLADRDGNPNYMAVLKKLHPEVHGDPEKTLENQQIRREQIKGMTIVGFETTAISLLYSLYELRSHPEINNKLEKAVKEKDSETVNNIAYEFFRMAPGIPRLIRAMEGDSVIDIVRDGKPEKVTLPKGTVVAYMVREGNRDPEQWPKDGPPIDEFHAERWNDLRGKKRPEAFMTFGAKQTSCLGEPFAALEFAEFYRMVYNLDCDIDPTDLYAPEAEPDQTTSSTDSDTTISTSEVSVKKPLTLAQLEATGPDINKLWIISELSNAHVKALLVPRDSETQEENQARKVVQE